MNALLVSKYNIEIDANMIMNKGYTNIILFKTLLMTFL